MLGLMEIVLLAIFGHGDEFEGLVYTVLEIFGYMYEKVTDVLSIALSCTSMTFILLITDGWNRLRNGLVCRYSV